MQIEIYFYSNRLLIILYFGQSIFHTFKLPFLLHTNSNNKCYRVLKGI